MSDEFCSCGPLGRLSCACRASSSPDRNAPRLLKFLGATWTSQRSFCPHKESGEGQPTSVEAGRGLGEHDGALPQRACWRRWGQGGASRRQSSQSPSLAGLQLKAGSKMTLDITSGQRGRVKGHCQVSALPSSMNLSLFIKRGIKETFNSGQVQTCGWRPGEGTCAGRAGTGGGRTSLRTWAW